MATHTLNINPASYAQIVQGLKTLEVRLRKDGVENYLEGDTIIIHNRETGEEVPRRAARVVQYNSLDALAANEDFQQAGNYPDRESFISKMRSFQTPEEESQFGLAAIHLESQ